MSLIATHCIHNVSFDLACVLCDSSPWDVPGCAGVAPTPDTQTHATITEVVYLLTQLAPADQALVLTLCRRLDTSVKPR